MATRALDPVGRTFLSAGTRRGSKRRPGKPSSRRRGAVYRERGHAFAADACEPLERAARTGRLRLEAFARCQYPGRRMPPGMLRGVCSVGYWDAPGPQDWGLDWHRNEGIELTLLESGRLAFAVEGHRPVDIRPGSLTITRPWQPHRIGDSHIGPGRLHWLILDVGVRRPNQAWRWPSWVVLTASDLDELTRLLRHQEEPHWTAGPDLRRCFARIGQVVASGAPPARLSPLVVLLNELLVLLLELLRRHKPRLDESLASSERTVEIFIDDLSRDPALLARPWTVHTMALQCGLGPTAFTQYCRESANETPLAHLNRLRLEYATALLRDHPEMPIKQIAASCGFATSQYFATAFKRLYGRTPRRAP